jgi:cytochrome b involved in lipid metabolism
MRNLISLSLLILMIITSGCSTQLDTQQEQTTNINSVQQSDAEQNSEEIQAEMQTYSLEEVSQHAAEGDCWMAINEKVYDVSDYGTHPGGSAILEGCGKDATALFETRPMGSGTPHSANARSMFDDYEIGVLA